MGYNTSANISNFDICPVYKEQTPPSIAILKKLKWEGCSGKGKRIPYLKTTTLPVTTADAIASGGSLTTGNLRLQYEWTDTDFGFISIVTDRQIDNRIVEELSIPNPQEHYVIQTGVEAVWQKYADLFVNGAKAGGNQYFDGLAAFALAYPTQVVPSSGILLQDLDTLLSRITAGDGVASAIIAHPRAIRAILDAIRASGIAADFRIDLDCGMRLFFNGVPILPHSYIGVDPTQLTNIYAVQLGIGSGISGIYPSNIPNISASIVKRPDDNTDVSYILIRLVCGLALYRPGAFSCLLGVNVASFPE